MATGRPLFPGSTVKEELHLIFRLLGQFPAAPSSLMPAGGVRTLSSPCSQLLPWFLCTHCTWVLATHTPSHLPLLSPRDPYRRDLARGDGSVRVPSLQFPPIPPSAAAQPCSQVMAPAFPQPLRGATPPLPGPVSALPSCRLDPDGISFLSSFLLVSVPAVPLNGLLTGSQLIHPCPCLFKAQGCKPYAALDPHPKPRLTRTCLLAWAQKCLCSCFCDGRTK